MYVMEAYKKIALEEISKICDADEIQDVEKMLGDIFQIVEEEESPSDKLWAYFDVTPEFGEILEEFVKDRLDYSTGPTAEDHFRNYLRLLVGISAAAKAI